MSGRITIGTGSGPRHARGVPAVALLALAFGSMGRPSAASAITIMPLGDSITYGYSNGVPVPGGYRSTLFRDLTSAGYTPTFVGSETANPDPTLPAAADGQEGHPGYLIAGTGAQAAYSISSHIDRWLAPGNGVNPNLILLQLGTNEILGNYHVESAPYELAALVTRITELRPNAEILLSTLPPSANATWEARIQAFNAALGGPDGIVAQLQKLGEKVVLVNAGGSLATSDLDSGGVHPAAAGYVKLGNAWFNAIESFESSNGTLVPAPEPSTLAVFGLGFLGLLAAAQARVKSSPA